MADIPTHRLILTNQVLAQKLSQIAKLANKYPLTAQIMTQFYMTEYEYD